jgi:hypothetical protein
MAQEEAGERAGGRAADEGFRRVESIHATMIVALAITVYSHTR